MYRRVEIRSCILDQNHVNCAGGQENQVYRQKELPFKGHELVHTGADKSPANHHVAPNHEVNLREEPYEAGNHLQVSVDGFDTDAGGMETTQETGGGQSRVRDQRNVFCQVEHGERCAVVFRVVTAGEFLFRFGNVEGSAVHFGGTRNEEQDKGDESDDRNLEDKPVEYGA